MKIGEWVAIASIQSTLSLLFQERLISELDIEILAGKRKGFLEFTGALHGISSNGSKFSLISYKESNAPRVIKIPGNTSRYIIFESDGKAIQAHKSKSWEEEEVQIQVPYQSQLTHLAVSKILETGQCDLTPLELLLNFINLYWRFSCNI